MPTPTPSLKVHPTPAVCSEGEEQLGARWVCMCVNAYVCADICACVTFYVFFYLLLLTGMPAWRLARSVCCRHRGFGRMDSSHTERYGKNVKRARDYMAPSGFSIQQHLKSNGAMMLMFRALLSVKMFVVTRVLKHCLYNMHQIWSLDSSMDKNACVCVSRNMCLRLRITC